MRGSRSASLTTIIVSLGCLLLGSVFLSPASAEVTSERVAEWFESERKAARSVDTIEACGIAWLTEDFVDLSPEELDALRKATAADSMHPDRFEASRLEQIERAGPMVMRFRLFTRDASTFRWMKDSASGYSDTVNVPEGSWTLWPDSLTPHDNAWPPHRSGFIFEIDRLFHGGVRAIDAEHLVVHDPVIKQDNTWTIECTKPSRRGYSTTIAFAGTWDEGHDRGFITRSVITRGTPKHGVEQVGSYAYDGWTFDERLSRWVASTVHMLREGRDVAWRTVRYDGTVALPEGGWDRVLATPVAGGIDPFRGKVTFKVPQAAAPHDENVAAPDTDVSNKPSADDESRAPADAR